MKFSAELMALAENESSGKSSADNYLRYTKLESGKPVNFALLDEDPLSIGSSGAKRKLMVQCVLSGS